MCSFLQGAFSIYKPCQLSPLVSSGLSETTPRLGMLGHRGERGEKFV